MTPRILWRRILCALDWHDWESVQLFYHGWEECRSCGRRECEY